jgi:hypothetical protein
MGATKLSIYLETNKFLSRKCASENENSVFGVFLLSSIYSNIPLLSPEISKSTSLSPPKSTELTNFLSSFNVLCFIFLPNVIFLLIITLFFLLFFLLLFLNNFG